MKKIKIALIFGTRPEAIKMAPVVLEMQKYGDYIKPIVIVTAQHREMLDQVLELFKIRPDIDLDIMSPNQTLFDVTSRVINGLGDTFAQTRPDLVLVHGDTTTTFAGALAAFYKQIPVGHVEAGLRTHNLYSPFPEEANRHLTGVLANWHFAPTKTAKENLVRENIKENKIIVTGNTVIDALKIAVKKHYHFADRTIAKAIQSGKKIILLTTHRRENLGEPLTRIYQALNKVLNDNADVEVIFPVHKNPKVRELAYSLLGDRPEVHLVEPLDYEPFVNLMERSYFVLSDSGGVQEEAPSLGKPVLVLRDNTERPEAVAAGTVKLVGTKSEDIYFYASKLLQENDFYKKMAEAANPYGDGFAAQRIVETILYEKEFLQIPPSQFSSDY